MTIPPQGEGYKQYTRSVKGMQVGTVFVGWVLQGFIMSNSEWESRREEEGAGGQPLA
jgi:hypothetical protein